jgi:hyaluronan synthase
MLLYILFGAVGASLYRNAPALDDKALPGCTVIVPAYNEGEHVAETLFSLLESDYPAEKLQIIAINDGSKDDTMEWIRYAEKRSAGRIVTLDLLKNGGKKHALYRGFHMAKFDIVVTVDSDSIVTRDSLRNIVSAFNEPEIGGVAGNIRIKNLADGMIPRMMDVGFMFGFEIIRSAQSLIGCVMCTPGALSAYRKSIVMPFLDEWLNQTFLGVPANIGEDRAIATMILQHNCQVTFQSNAVASTCIPYTYGRFCKMLLRWLRSDVRENLLMTGHFFKNFRISFSYAAFAFHLGNLIVGTFMPLAALIIFLEMVCKFTPAGLFHAFYYGAVLGIIGALIPAVIYARRVSFLEAVWAPVYTVYSMFLLWWIPVYALFTARNSNWLTRELALKKESGELQELCVQEQSPK